MKEGKDEMKSIPCKILAAVLFCAMMLSFAACGPKDEPSSPGTSETTGGTGSPGASETTGGSAEPAAPAKDTVTIAVTQDSGTLDPMIITGLDVVYALHMVYDQLWYFDENGDEVMMLAESRERLDPLTYRVRLREGIAFSNGNTFEADDVLYSLDHANNRPGQPGILPQLDVPNCVIVDQYTIDLVFTEYRISLMESIAALCMIDKQTSEEDPETLATRPIGTGPYTVTEYVVNSHLNLTRRDEYWGTMPTVKNYSFIQLKEESQRVNALETGEADVVNIPFQDIEYVRTLDGVRVDQTAGFMGSGLYFNIAQASVFYENADARRAVAYAIDREAINNLAYAGTGSVPNADIIGGPNTTDGDDRRLNQGIYADDYNPELAKQLAESSGLTGKTIRLINNGSSAAAMTAELIQANCKAVGITVDVMTLDMGTWTTYLFDDTQYDMCIDGVPIAATSYSSSYLFCYAYMAAGSFANYDYEGHDRVMELLDTILSDDDVQNRVEGNYEFSKICIDNMLWYNLVAPSDALGISADLKGNVRNGANVVCLYRNLSWS
jgi:peptide/nickel transport system substrate-binding protein